MNLITKVEVIWLSALLLAIGWSIAYGDYTDPIQYLEYCRMTEVQAKYVVEKAKETKDPNHYIARVWAISSHEQGRTFVDWKQKYFAGRLKKWMEYKDFNTQVDWRTDQYNRVWYKNYKASDWINRSHYCVSDTHWWGKWCPNRVANVPSIAKQYRFDDMWELNKPTEKELHIGDTDKVQKQAITKICRVEKINIKKGEYLEISYLGKIRMRIRNLWKNDEIKICRDV